MPKINTDAQLEISKANLSLIVANYEISDFTFMVLTGGIENTTVKIECAYQVFALRIYRQNRKSLEQVNLELSFVQYLKQNNIPVPNIFATNSGTLVSQTEINEVTWVAILQEFKQGEDVENYSYNIVLELAKYQSRMHVLGGKFTESQPNLRNNYKELREEIFGDKIDKSTIEKNETLDFLKRAKTFSYTIDSDLPLGFNHLDFDSGNILINDDEIVAILDFDDMAYSPCVVCLSYTLCDILLITKSIGFLKLFLEEYQLQRALTQTEIDQIQPIMLFRCYVFGAMEIAFQGEGREYLSQILDLEQKITQLSVRDLI